MSLPACPKTTSALSIFWFAGPKLPPSARVTIINNFSTLVSVFPGIRLIVHWEKRKFIFGGTGKWMFWKIVGIFFWTFLTLNLECASSSAESSQISKRKFQSPLPTGFLSSKRSATSASSWHWSPQPTEYRTNPAAVLPASSASPPAKRKSLPHWLHLFPAVKCRGCTWALLPLHVHSTVVLGCNLRGWVCGRIYGPWSSGMSWSVLAVICKAS